jgi:TolA-binding protein
LNTRATLIKQTEQKIANSKQKISSLQDLKSQYFAQIKKETETSLELTDWLKFSISASKNNGNYQCRHPSSYQWRKKKPNEACSNNNEANQLAGAMCAVAIGGAEGCGLLVDILGKRLGGPMLKALSNPACGASVAKLRNQEYTQQDFLGDVFLGFMKGYSDEAARQGNYLEAMIGNFIYYGMILNNFNSCVENARRSCSKLDKVWKEENSLRKGGHGGEKLYVRCQANVTQIKNSADKVQKAREELQIIKTNLNLEGNNLRQLEKQLRNLKSR